ncbi:allene oxide cyclase barrel-like domain-containing protein [Actinocorallia sp. A-T 12471]|uniref:allene oxide cyclase barrel-like domain-containing protein n=1 Tax=Actinocorallia sp. A-T 12471 TaxID=3089813 RepID=UPI0029CB3159|nr:hypothetical protein [Actinocorallia sp. A-T 12471]MDX6742418.1 hypothetical protein [Actinocorallia sp. A-T 12471]
MQKIGSVLVAAAAVTAALGFSATSASAGSRVYYETVGEGDVEFIPACIPGPQNPGCDPRGAGSVFISWGDLSYTQGGAAVGTVRTECTTTHKVGDDYWGFCQDDLVTPEGNFTAIGLINETGLERYEPQTLFIAGPPGGSLEVQQIVYPNVFKLTVN